MGGTCFHLIHLSSSASQEEAQAMSGPPFPSFFDCPLGRGVYGGSGADGGLEGDHHPEVDLFCLGCHALVEGSHEGKSGVEEGYGRA